MNTMSNDGAADPDLWKKYMPPEGGGITTEALIDPPGFMDWDTDEKLAWFRSREEIVRLNLDSFLRQGVEPQKLLVFLKHSRLRLLKASQAVDEALEQRLQLIADVADLERNLYFVVRDLHEKMATQYPFHPLLANVREVVTMLAVGIPEADLKKNPPPA